MASHGYPLGLAPVLEQNLCRVAKDYETLFPSSVTGKDMIRPFLNLRAMDRLGSRQFFDIGAAVQRPALMGIQDSCPPSLLFGFDSPYPGIRHENFPQFHMSTLREVDDGVVDLSVFSDMIRIEELRSHMNPHSSAFSRIHIDSELESQKQLLDMLKDLGRSSGITVQRDRQFLFSCTETEMKDLVSIVAEYYLANSLNKWRTQSVLIPHFDRLDSTEWVNVGQPSILEPAKVAPLGRPEKVERKRSNKRKTSQRATKEKDLYKRNYFHACESLLSIILNKSQSRKMAILSLKKSGPEIPELLTQFSAGIAGTGIAVLFSVMSKVASGQVPLCASKLISTGIGFGLMWLASAVIRLRDSILYISKNASKVSFSEEEMARRVDKSINEIFFRAVTLMIIALLRFA